MYIARKLSWRPEGESKYPQNILAYRGNERGISLRANNYTPKENPMFEDPSMTRHSAAARTASLREALSTVHVSSIGPTLVCTVKIQHTHSYILIPYACLRAHKKKEVSSLRYTGQATRITMMLPYSSPSIISPIRIKVKSIVVPYMEFRDVITKKEGMR